MATDYEIMQQLQQAAAQELATHRQETERIIEIGREKYGSSNFDEHSQVVADAFGGNAANLVALARQFDDPPALIAELAKDPDGAARLAKLPAPRLAVELARLDAKLSPSSAGPNMSAEPQWRMQARSGGFKERDLDDARLADRATDKQWNRAFEARWERKHGRRLP